MSRNWKRVLKLKIDVGSGATTSSGGGSFGGLTLGGGLGFGLGGGSSGVDTLDCSDMRVKFTVYRHTIQTPNELWIRIFNLKAETCSKILDAANPGSGKLLTIQAGYEDGYGEIYKGNMIYATTGRESQTDTFIDINCQDGGDAITNATLSKTFPAESKQEDHMKNILETFKKFGVEEGKTKNLITDKYPKSFTQFGMASDIWRTLGRSNDNQTFIDMMKAYTVPLDYTNGEIQLDESHGMIGLPQATTAGVIVTCLINPVFKPKATIILDLSKIQPMKLPPGYEGLINVGDANRMIGVADGKYIIESIEYHGDTRGQEWYAILSAHGNRSGGGSNAKNAIL